MKINLYTSNGQVKSEVSLLEKYSNLEVNSLLQQAKRVFEDNSHPNLNRVKTRSEVNISRRKIYKQKGTGGARHGAKSAHIFVGGGVVHGPTGIKRVLELPKKMRSKAVDMAILDKAKNKRLFLIESLTTIKKTIDAQKVLNSLSITGKVLVVLSSSSKDLSKFFRNIENLKVLSFENVNVFDILSVSSVVAEASLFAAIKKETESKKIISKKVVRKERTKK